MRARKTMPNRTSEHFRALVSQSRTSSDESQNFSDAQQNVRVFTCFFEVCPKLLHAIVEYIRHNRMEPAPMHIDRHSDIEGRLRQSYVGLSTWWSTSKVNLSHLINLRPLCCANFVTFPSKLGSSLCWSAAHRDKSREWNVSKQKWNPC